MGDWGEAKVKKLETTLATVPHWTQFGLLYLLLGFTPVPNDLVMAALVILGYRVWTIIPLVTLSGITIATITAYTGQSIINLLF